MDITIIGCGNMGRGLAQCFSQQNNIFLYDRNADKAEDLERQGYGKVVHQVKDALKKSEIVFLAVKPQNLKTVAELFNIKLKFKQTLISLLAGIRINQLNSYFPNHRIIRMMPNLALIYNEGLIGLTTNEQLEKEEQEKVTNLCGPLGKIYWLPESKIDAFNSLASSGPAFVFAIYEAMVDAGIGMGLSVQESQGIVQQLIKGSLTLLEKSKKHPAELKWQVTSPAGTTIAGLKAFEEHAVRAGIINTFYAAYERAKQLKDIQDK